MTTGPTDYNAKLKTHDCQCGGHKVTVVGPLRLCQACDVAVITLAATSLGKRAPDPPEAEG